MVLEGNIDISICSLISLLYMKQTGQFGVNFQDYFANSMAVLMLGALLYTPVHALIRALQYSKQLKT